MSVDTVKATIVKKQTKGGYSTRPLGTTNSLKIWVVASVIQCEFFSKMQNSDSQAPSPDANLYEKLG
jgi:hypothetical protein